MPRSAIHSSRLDQRIELVLGHCLGEERRLAEPATRDDAFAAPPGGYAGFEAVMNDPLTAQQLVMELVTVGPEDGTDAYEFDDASLRRRLKRDGLVSGGRAQLKATGVIFGDETTFPDGSFAYVNAYFSEFRTPRAAKRGLAHLVKNRRSHVPDEADATSQKVQLSGLDQAFAISATRPKVDESGSLCLIVVLGQHGQDVVEFVNFGQNCTEQTLTAGLATIQGLASSVGQRIG